MGKKIKRSQIKCSPYSCRLSFTQKSHGLCWHTLKWAATRLCMAPYTMYMYMYKLYSLFYCFCKALEMHCGPLDNDHFWNSTSVMYTPGARYGLMRYYGDRMGCS